MYNLQVKKLKKKIKSFLSSVMKNDPIDIGRLYHFALHNIINNEKGYKKNILIIGANDGKLNDPGYEIIKYAKNTKVILIEPLKYLNPYIQQNFEGLDFEVINCVISGAAKNIPLYTIKQEFHRECQPSYAANNGWPYYRAPSGVTSSSLSNVKKWIARHFPSIDPAMAIEKIYVKCCLMQEIKKISNVSKFDIVQIDVEGAELDLLKEVLNGGEIPYLIFYEHKHLSRRELAEIQSRLTIAGFVYIAGKSDTLAFRMDPPYER